MTSDPEACLLLASTHLPDHAKLGQLLCGPHMYCLQQLSEQGWQDVAVKMNLLEARTKALRRSVHQQAAFRVVDEQCSEMHFLCRDGTVLIDLSEPADLEAAREGQPTVFIEGQFQSMLGNPE